MKIVTTFTFAVMLALQTFGQLANVIIKYDCDGNITILSDKKLSTLKIESASGIFDFASSAQNLNGGFDVKVSKELFKFEPQNGFDTVDIGKVARKCLPCSTLKSDIDTNVNNLLGSTFGGGSLNSFKIKCESENCGGISGCTSTSVSTNNSRSTTSQLLGNPSRGLSYLVLSKRSDVHLFNTLGEQVYARKLEAGKHRVDLQNLTQGVYLFRVNYKLGIETHQLIIE